MLKGLCTIDSCKKPDLENLILKYLPLSTGTYLHVYMKVCIHTYGLAQFENLFKLTHGLAVVGKEGGRMFAHGYPMCKLECKQWL